MFRDDVDRTIFVELLSELDERFGVEVHAYCLMGNHFHLLVRSQEARLSHAMQWLSGNFTKRANARRGVDGSIFRSRFLSVSVLDDCHARYLVRYIHANPKDLGTGRSLVQYRWSSLAAYVEKRPTGWLVTSTVLEWFGHDRRRLLCFVVADVDGRWGEDLDPRPAALIDRPAGASEIIEEIAKFAELSWGLAGGSLRRDAVRLITVLIAADEVGVDRSELSRWAGVSESTLRSMLSRSRARIGSNTVFRDAVETVSDALRSVSETQRSGSVVGHVRSHPRPAQARHRGAQARW